MIHEERVKELFQIALYDEHEDRRAAKAGKYYRKDYVAKEMIKSFFAGTLAYILILALCVLNVANSLLDQLNTMNYQEIAIYLAVSYFAFIALYLLITYLIYQIRYTNNRRKLKKYTGHLKQLRKIYSREDRLKM